MVNPQTVIKSILLNLGAPAQIVILFQARGVEEQWGYAAHASESFNILAVILNSLTGYRDHRLVPGRAGPAQPRFSVLIVQVCSRSGPEAVPEVEQTASLGI